jgi:hypothetical protein
VRYRAWNEPRPRDGQRLKWIAPERLAAEDILEVDRPFIEGLRQRQAAPGAATAGTDPVDLG